MSRLNNKYGKQSKKVKFSKKNFEFFSIRTFGTDNITPTIPTLMPIIRRENTVLQLANMVGVTRVGRGAISQILHSPKEGDLTGQEWCTAVPKSLPNPPRTGSKTERHGVRKREVRKDFSFFVIPIAGVVAPVAARQTCLRSVNVQCCYATLES